MGGSSIHPPTRKYADWSHSSWSLQASIDHLHHTTTLPSFPCALKVPERSFSLVYCRSSCPSSQHWGIEPRLRFMTRISPTRHFNPPKPSLEEGTSLMRTMDPAHRTLCLLLLTGSRRLIINLGKVKSHSIPEPIVARRWRHILRETQDPRGKKDALLTVAVWRQMEEEAVQSASSGW